MTNGASNGLAIRCVGLKKTYPGKPPVEAVRGIDLEIPVGECFGLLGPNGAGKTTTLEILEGLLAATAGELEIFGMKWGSGQDAAIRNRMGVSLQETRLSEKLNVRETVTLFRSLYPRGLDPDAAIARVSLQEKSKALVGKLSGGQKQRLAVACALVGDPDLLFLDEPTTGLDPQSRRQLWDVVRELGDEGRTVFITTHYMDEAEKLCQRVAVVDQGKIIALDSPKELIAGLGEAHVVEFSTNETPPESDDFLLAAAGVTSIRREAGGFVAAVHEPHVALPAILGALHSNGLTPASLTTRHASLEDVFVSLTGRHLRDGDSK